MAVPTLHLTHFLIRDIPDQLYAFLPLQWCSTVCARHGPVVGPVGSSCPSVPFLLS